VLKIWGGVSPRPRRGHLRRLRETFEYRYYKGLAIIKEKLGNANE